MGDCFIRLILRLKQFNSSWSPDVFNSCINRLFKKNVSTLKWPGIFSSKYDSEQSKEREILPLEDQLPSNIYETHTSWCSLFN